MSRGCFYWNDPLKVFFLPHFPFTTRIRFLSIFLFFFLTKNKQFEGELVQFLMHYVFIPPLMLLIAQLDASAESVFWEIKQFIHLLFCFFFLTAVLWCASQRAKWQYTVPVFGSLQIIKQPTHAGRELFLLPLRRADTAISFQQKIHPYLQCSHWSRS